MNVSQIQTPQFQRTSFSAVGSYTFEGSRHPLQLLEIYFGSAIGYIEIWMKIPEEGDDHGSQWIQYGGTGVSIDTDIEFSAPWSVKVVCTSYTSGTIYVKLYGYSPESLAIYGARSK